MKGKTSFGFKRTVFLCFVLVVYLITSMGFTPLLKSVFVYNLPSPAGTAYTDTRRFYEQYIEYANMLTTYLKHKDKEITVDSESFVAYAIENGIQNSIKDRYEEYIAMLKLARIFGEIERAVGKAEPYSKVSYNAFVTKLFGQSFSDGNLHTTHPEQRYATEYHETTEPSPTKVPDEVSDDLNIGETGDVQSSEKITAFIIKYSVTLPDKPDTDNMSRAEELLEQYYNAINKDYYSFDDLADSLYNLYSDTVQLFSEKELIRDYSSDSIDDYYFERMQNTELNILNNFKAGFENAKQGVNSYSNFKYILYDKLTGKTESNFYEGSIKPENPLDIGDAAADFSWMLVFSSEQGLKIGKPVYENGTALTLTPSQYNRNDLADKTISSLQRFCSDRYILYLALPQTFEQSDRLSVPFEDYNYLASTFNSNLILFLIGFIISIILSLALILTSGESPDGGRLYFIDRIFNDIHFIVSGGVIATMIVIVSGMTVSLAENIAIPFIGYDSPEYRFEEINQSFGLIVPSALMIAAAAGLELFSSISRNTRLKRYFSHSLTVKILALLGRLFRKLVKLIKRFFAFIFKPFKRIAQMAKMVTTDSLKALKKNLLLFGLLFVGANGVLILITGIFMVQVIVYGEYGLLALILIGLTLAFNAACLYKIFMFISALDNIAFAASQIALGKYDNVLNPAAMPRPLAGLASDIMNINEGTKAAVETAVKGERLKAELITNVSHDLKTPLTSIVNYVDLLQRSGEYGEPANEYIGILKEKSNRLKGLIEDLMEASKVSTGNVKLNLSPVNLYELAMQISGENSDVLEEKGIEIIIASPEVQPIVLADSQQTWRIFENLFSNVRKYTMPGTRVYVETNVENGYGCFSVKNISAHALNIPVEELTQRFVRADEARTGEGSGLGLSIAESLCELQKGQFTIHIDGDLFKAKVCLPIYRGELPQA